MYLFFDGVSSRWYIALFSEEREILWEKYFEISGNESTKTIPLIDEFMSSQSMSYDDIKNIVCVSWPGSFTWIRTLSLVVNTISYLYPHILLTWVNFFDMYQNYPIVKASSKRDLFVKYENSATIQVQQNQDFIEHFTWNTIYWDIQQEQIINKYRVRQGIDYASYIKNVTLWSEKRIAPLYIKKPNIS